MTFVARSLMMSIFILLGACNSESELTTRGVYTPDEVRDLEISAAANDRNALRELDVYYGLEGKLADRERIHRRRFELGDPEALDEEAMMLARRARAAKDIGTKKRILNDALLLARRSATVEGSTDVDQDLTVQYILKQIAITG